MVQKTAGSLSRVRRATGESPIARGSQAATPPQGTVISPWRVPVTQPGAASHLGQSWCGLPPIRASPPPPSPEKASCQSGQLTSLSRSFWEGGCDALLPGPLALIFWPHVDEPLDSASDA